MREILFRGKRLGTGEWIYGSLLQEQINGATCECIIVDLGYARDRRQIVVNTCGQYTGLQDKRGAKIFEGDIIRLDFDTRSTTEIVEFRNGRFVTVDPLKPFRDEALVVFVKNATVIGNIHDNPELCQLPR